MKLNRRAQSITECAIVVGVMAAAFLAIQVYIKRGVQGKVKDMTDAMLPPGTVANDVRQLSQINPLIPMLNPGTSQSGYSRGSSTRSIAHSGNAISYSGSANSVSESYIGVRDPSKEVE
jgi:hypothetical protein